MIAAATRLFIRDGYLGATMAAIAAEAEVAVQTLYLSFGSKLGLLKAALDVAIVGDEEPIPLLERGWARQLAEAAEGPQAVRIFVHEVIHICARTYPIYAALQAAAGSDAGDLLAENKQQRKLGIRSVAVQLSLKPGFASDLTAQQAADLIYAVASEDLYGLFVADCGWTPAVWEERCAKILTSSLFPGA